MSNHDNKLFFKLFLVLYGGFLFIHVWEIGFDSWKMIAGLLGGMALAFAAHKGHGYVPSLFLVGHMTIEWYHHAVHGSHYSGSEITFHGIHALMDAIFLFVEAKEHYAKYALLFLSGVCVTLGIIFVINYIPAPPTTISFSPFMSNGEEHSHKGGALHYIVIGGILGCVLSHLLFPVLKKRKIKQG